MRIRNKALWEKGDFTQIGVAMRESGDDFVQTLGVVPGMQVLDLGCVAMGRPPRCCWQCAART